MVPHLEDGYMKLLRTPQESLRIIRSYAHSYMNTTFYGNPLNGCEVSLKLKNIKVLEAHNQCQGLSSKQLASKARP